MSPAVAAAMREAANALAAAGYEIVDEKTPGFARAFDLWFEMLIPEFRRFMHADFERDGDEGIRTAMRFVLDNVPESDADAHLRAVAERTRLIREWNLFLAHTPLVLTPVCTQPPYAHGFDIESKERTMQIWRESATLMAVPVLGLPAMAVPTGAGRGVADRRPDRRPALSRGPDAGRGRSDRGARAAPHAHRSASEIPVAAGVSCDYRAEFRIASLGEFHADCVARFARSLFLRAPSSLPHPRSRRRRCASSSIRT